MVTAPAPTQSRQHLFALRSDDVFVLRFPKGWLSADLLMQIGELNKPWRFERSAEGALEISVPAGNISSYRSLRVSSQILDWYDLHEAGMPFESSAGFQLAPSDVRSPDAAWISDERLQNVVSNDEGIWPVCPDLVVEIRSRGQSLQQQQEKMQEWMSAGTRLGWLIDPFTDDGAAWIYRDGHSEPDRLDRPESLSGEDVAEGLTVDLANVWR